MEEILVREEKGRVCFGDDRVEELLDVLEEVIGACCAVSRRGETLWDSMANGAYAEGIVLLAKYGRAVLLEEHEKRVLAKPASC